MLTTVPTLSVVRISQDILFQFEANHPDYPLPLANLLQDAVSVQQQIRKQLQHAIRTSYYSYTQSTSAQVLLDPLEPVGNKIYHTLLPTPIRSILEALTHMCAVGTPLVLITNDHNFPWEIAHDGNDYLCHRWSITRRLLSAYPPARSRRATQGGRALLIGNPTADLPAAQQELDTIYDLLSQMVGDHDSMPVRQLTTLGATKKQVCKALSSPAHRLIHYSGHVVAGPDNAEQGGLLLAGEELLTPAEVERLLEGRPWVFLNACNSGLTSGEDSFDIDRSGMGPAIAFVVGGATVVVSTIWSVPDQSAYRFAGALYLELSKGAAIGAAMRQARLSVREKDPFDPIWSAYVVYGKPDEVFLQSDQRAFYPVVTMLDVRLHGLRSRISYGPDELDLRAGQADRLIDEIRNEARRFGGDVLQLDFDHVRLVFGLPLVETDRGRFPTDGDLERALLVATTIHTRIRQGMETNLPPELPPVQLSIGVATGAVIFNQAKRYCFGMPVELAAWLAARAQPGQTLCEIQSVAPFHNRIDFERWSGEDDFLHGTPSLNIYSIKRTRYEDEPALGPLVGRRDELHMLLHVVTRIQQGRSGKVIDLYGEAGVGKSHLVHEFTQHLLAQSVQYSSARCRPQDGMTDHALLSTLLHNLLGLNKNVSPERTVQALQNWFGQRSQNRQVQTAHFFSVLGYILGVEIDGPTPAFQSDINVQSAEIANAILYLLAAIVDAKGVLVLILEDLHYADEQSLSVLHRVAAKISALPVLLLTVYRTQWTPEWRADTRYHLPGLSQEECTTLIDAHLGRPLHPETIDEIRTWANHNPLFIIELIKVLRQEERFYLSHGALRLSQPLIETGIPTTIQGIIQSRIAQLSPTVREALEEAAILGAKFPCDLFVQMIEQHPDRTDADSVLKDLETFGFIRSDFLNSESSFVHDLIHDEIINNILFRKRRVYHLRAANAWQKRLSTSALFTHEEYNHFATHSLQSICKIVDGEFVILSQDEIDSHRLLTTTDILLKAGDLCRMANAYKAAATWRRKTLDLLAVLEDDPAYIPLRIRAFDSMAESCEQLGERTVALSYLIDTFTLLQQCPVLAPIQRQKADVARRIGRALMFQANHQTALQWMSVGLECLFVDETRHPEQLSPPDQLLLSLIHIHSGSIYYRQGDYDQALLACQHGLEIANRFEGKEKVAAKTIAEGCKVMGAVLDAQGQAKLALTLYERSYQIYQELNDLYNLVQVQDNMSTALFALGHWDKAFALDRQGIEFWENIGEQNNVAFAALNLGMIHLNRGEWTNAEDYLRQSLIIAEAHEIQFEVGRTLFALSQLWYEKNQRSEANALLTRALQIFAELKAAPLIDQVEKLQIRYSTC